MLATYRFVRSTLNNRGQSRTYRRETWLSERVLRPNDLARTCASCYAAISTGETYAVSDYHRYCQNCYGELPEKLAEASVTIDAIDCVYVAAREDQGVTIHDFIDCAVVISASGSTYRFRDLAEAQACLEAARAMASAGGARDLPILSAYTPNLVLS